MNRELARAALAEAVGTAFLVAAVIGSGIAAQRLSPHDVGLQLLENSLITGAALVALILALQPVSAAFNPAVTLVEVAFRTVSARAATVLISAQLIGGLVGAIAANLMFDLDAVTVSGHHRAGGGRALGEVIATLGLLLVIFGSAGSGRGDRVAFAVGGYITAAYWFTSSTSFANPAVTVARMFTDTFAGIAPTSAVLFIAMQLVGAAVAYLLIRVLYPHPPRLPAGTDGAGRAAATTHRPTVLFVCVHNAGRSQMAAGWLTHLAGDAVEVRSAGSEPAERINPVAVRAMREVGIDIAGEQPKVLTVDAVSHADVVITMGCGDTCPYYPGKRYEDWTLADPAGQPIEVVRQVRDDLRQRVGALLDDLLSGSALSR